jgi:hypothetical protein
MINFKSAFQNLERTKNLEVIDLAEAVMMAMPEEAKNAALIRPN